PIPTRSPLEATQETSIRGRQANPREFSPTEQSARAKTLPLLSRIVPLQHPTRVHEAPRAQRAWANHAKAEDLDRPNLRLVSVGRRSTSMLVRLHRLEVIGAPPLLCRR